ncbi:hypothetical protein RMATCC62417_02908 [Rhizopus microsporus]|nr:hypothetical protein RMATCC62417_02908 [Rhizopus microsporus]
MCVMLISILGLYGPIYTNETQTYSVPASDHLQGIKPVLKKHSTMIVQPTALPTCSDDTMLELFDYYSSSFTTTRNNSFSSISSSSTATSTSHSTKVGVSFNPEIIEIEYQPEYPVSPLLQSEDEEESNKEEEDDVWSSLLLYVQRNHSAVNIFILLFKSFVSITTTWLLYQRLSKWTTKKKNFCK